MSVMLPEATVHTDAVRRWTVTQQPVILQVLNNGPHSDRCLNVAWMSVCFSSSHAWSIQETVSNYQDQVLTFVYQGVSKIVVVCLIVQYQPPPPLYSHLSKVCLIQIAGFRRSTLQPSPAPAFASPRGS